MDSKRNFLFISVSLIFSVFAAWNLFGPQLLPEYDEARRRAAEPEWNFTTEDARKRFTSQAEVYFLDALPLRNLLFVSYKTLSYSLFGLPAKERRFLIELNGEFFDYHTQDDFVSLTDYTRGAFENVRARVAEFKKRNIPYSLVVVPPKQLVFEMPGDHFGHDDRRHTMAIQRALIAEMPSALPDVAAILKAQRDSPHPLYIKDDLHWAHEGARLTAKHILETWFGPDSRTEPFTVMEKMKVGDYARMLGVYRRWPYSWQEPATDYHLEWVSEYGGLTDARYSVAIGKVIVPKNEGRSLLIIGDSQIHSFRPYFFSRFDEVVSIRIPGDEICPKDERRKVDFDRIFSYKKFAAVIQIVNMFSIRQPKPCRYDYYEI